MRNQTKRKGFSLLELVAVVTLIGIVAAVTMYRLNSVDKTTAKANVASENVNLLQGAAERYRFDNGSYAASITALVTAGYLPAYPKTPDAAGAYAIDGNGIVTYSATGS
jgi:prepilin-type N-terminal cleavage/methylation domain-containing protein